MPEFIDQTGKTIQLVHPPHRIVSLVPSQTELLAELQLDREVAGITKFCIHPEDWFRKKQRVGGTKQLHLEAIRALKPDLILANVEENVREQVEALADLCPVWVSDVSNLETALEMIRQVGLLTGRVKQARELISTIEMRFNDYTPAPPFLKATYLIWRDPYMTAGGDTFIHAMMEKAGFENAFKKNTRYPAVTIDDIRHSGTEVLLLSSEPFPFAQKHVDELQAQLPATKIILVDGEMFSWYGSRMKYAPGYFRELMQ
ncbi:MAG TPA: helical backbone metal receptor [Chitinophagaceae bacterium]|nr:helical backbone metal receptor [Chitinophagaceae bacterium]